MPATQEAVLSPDELGQILAGTDPAALLVPPRLLRRIIKHDRKLTHLGLQVPHRKSYVIGRETLLALADRAELGVSEQHELPEAVILLNRPTADALTRTPRGLTLLKYWRLLFHARVHEAVTRRFDEIHVTPAAVQQRVHRIGQTAFAEARTVLRQEHFLLPPADDRTVYEEFAAIYLDLKYFAPSLVRRYFPALDEPARTEALLAEDVDAAALFVSTRPAGAAEPACEPESASETSVAVPAPPPRTTISERAYTALMASAGHAAKAGNDVRAAIRHFQASAVAESTEAKTAADAANADITRLVNRFISAVGRAGTVPLFERWQAALAALLPQAARGIWPSEARLLYELQKVCVDHERPIYAPDLVEWAYSHFRQPLVRPLPNQPLVLAVKHLRVAISRLPSIQVAEADRHSLSSLLREALHNAETRVRERFRPALVEALQRVGLEPRNLPERLGRDKLIEELLDRITERGFLNMSDLRDALARNQLKLNDLSGPDEFFRGDPLIRANRELAARVPAIYRRGEFYLRWLQRGSALAFGTRPGQWFVLFFALPFLGAFATIVFTQEMHHLFLLLTGETRQSHGSHHLHLASYLLPTTLLGAFYFLLIHWAPFRRFFFGALTAVWKATRLVLIDAPAAFFHLPLVRRVLESRLYALIMGFLVKPLLAAALTWLILYWSDVDAQAAARAATVVFVAAAVFLNTRLGRDLEEAVTDAAVRNWAYVTGFLPGLVRLLMNVFKAALEGVDRFFYTVDEWLRFRAGQGRLTLAFKTALGFAWFLVTYIVRLYVNVFIEPTFNPIKHFPVVTVAAKLLVPFWPMLLGTIRSPGLLAAPFEFMGHWTAFLMANLILHSIPGAAGFLVWEFKENWRLYRTNRPRTLRPEMVGHHGETVTRLLRPGFHSGTLPKLYAKLRRAERRAARRGGWRTTRKLRETLHHVEESVRRFGERELVAFVNTAKGWNAGKTELRHVNAGSNRIRLCLACPALGTNDVELSFNEQEGWLVAQIDKPGWVQLLSDSQKGVFCAALLGFYQKAGVDLVREQVESLLPSPCPPYDIGEDGLVVWPGEGYETEVRYDLDDGPLVAPKVDDGNNMSMPSLPRDEVLLKERPITWEAWVEAWERDQAGESPVTVLPRMGVFTMSI